MYKVVRKLKISSTGKTKEHTSNFCVKVMLKWNTKKNTD